METVLERLQHLQQKKSAALKNNRRDVYLEAKRMANKANFDSDEDDNGNGNGNIKEETGVNKQSDFMQEYTGDNVISANVLKSLGYTAQQDSDWQKKNNFKQQNKGVHDHKHIAERTYRKRIAELKEAPESANDPLVRYHEQKRIYKELEEEGYSEAQIRGKLTDERLLQQESNRIREFEAKAYKKRKVTSDNAKMSVGITQAINEKNRAFNEKLNRTWK